MTTNLPVKSLSGGRKIPFARKFRYLAEAAGFFAIIGFFRLFDIDHASSIGGWIGRKLIAPTRFIGGMWSNLGRVMAEYAHLDKIRWKDSEARLTLSGFENVPPEERQKNGVLLVSAHFANWETMPIAAREFGISGAAIARPTNNPYVNAWLEKLRIRNGLQELISKGGDGLRRARARELLRRSLGAMRLQRRRLRHSRCVSTLLSFRSRTNGLTVRGFIFESTLPSNRRTRETQRAISLRLQRRLTRLSKSEFENTRNNGYGFIAAGSAPMHR
jgi:hypothetical protein